MFTDLKVRLKMLLQNSKKWLLFILLLALFLAPFLLIIPPAWKTFQAKKALYEHLINIDTKTNDNTITLPEGSQMYIVQPQGEQDVIIIGDPDKVNVKPKKK